MTRPNSTTTKPTSNRPSRSRKSSLSAARFYYSPEFTGESGDGLLLRSERRLRRQPRGFSFSGAVGFQTVDTPGFFAGEDEYTTWNFSGTYSDRRPRLRPSLRQRRTWTTSRSTTTA